MRAMVPVTATFSETQVAGRCTCTSSSTCITTCMPSIGQAQTTLGALIPMPVSNTDSILIASSADNLHVAEPPHVQVTETSLKDIIVGFKKKGNVRVNQQKKVKIRLVRFQQCLPVQLNH